MAGRDIVVIGASAGRVEALSKLLRGVREDLQAAVLVVVHRSTYTEHNTLAEVLARSSKLPLGGPRMVCGSPLAGSTSRTRGATWW